MAEREDFDPAAMAEAILNHQDSQQRLEADYDRCGMAASNRIAAELSAKGIETINPANLQKAMDDLITAASYFTLLLTVAGVEAPDRNRDNIEGVFNDITDKMLDLHDRFEVKAV